jgi:transcription elongation factor GreA
MSYPITLNGFRKLEDELSALKKRRLEIAARIDEARGHGDLKENAEYHAAKEEQSLNETRIMQIEEKLADANVIDPKFLTKDRVVFGSTVKIENTDTEVSATYQIVSDEEVSVSNGRISIQSPIARALLNKRPGDIISVQTPGGEKEFEVLEII